ncbi:unnamed protein product [Gadus morhua 'NCC']
MQAESVITCEGQLSCDHVVACEKSEVELSCDSGQTIALIKAFYGHANQTTCIQDVLSSKSNTFDCPTSNATEVVAERCNGESRCTVPANNTVFEDPCPGTAKYLEVAYTCECPL